MRKTLIRSKAWRRERARKAGLVGGKARMLSLTPAERRELARKGGLASWKKDAQ